MAAALDGDGAVDWVMASSLVTEVDERGVYKNDVMAYERKEAVQDLCYLESCYVSYVGGMYRKSVHDRYGYYDESFRGAGDTEFKNRILRHIKVKFLPETLGLFLNYPEERTARRLVRWLKLKICEPCIFTVRRAASHYAFDARPPEHVYSLLQMAVGYRKSFCRHISTDVEYAKNLTDYLIGRGILEGSVRVLAGDLGEMLEVMRSLELAPAAPSRCLNLAFAFWGRFLRFQSKHAGLLKAARPVYHVFNRQPLRTAFVAMEVAVTADPFAGHLPLAARMKRPVTAWSPRFANSRTESAAFPLPAFGKNGRTACRLHHPDNRSA